MNGGAHVPDHALAGTAPCVLIVEGEPLIAFDLETSFHDRGIRTSFAGTLIEALTAVRAMGRAEAWRPTAALVDLRLGDDDAFPVADALRERRLPFAFHTGCAHRARQCVRFSPVTIYGKPAPAFEIAAAFPWAAPSAVRETDSGDTP